MTWLWGLSGLNNKNYCLNNIAKQPSKVLVFEVKNYIIRNKGLFEYRLLLKIENIVAK